MTRCTSVNTSSEKLIQCTREAGHPVGSVGSDEMHQNFASGHKVKWPEFSDAAKARYPGHLPHVDLLRAGFDNGVNWAREQEKP